MPVKIFFCYAREDELLRKGLEKHLRTLKRQGLIDVWHDRDISAGTEWEQEIDNHLNSAHIILLLVSPDFMDSDYCYGKEMQQAMERHKCGEAIVIPVILRPVYWQGAPFSKLQALPTDGKPIKSWHDEDEAFYDVVKGILEKIKEKPAYIWQITSNRKIHIQTMGGPCAGKTSYIQMSLKEFTQICVQKRGYAVSIYKEDRPHDGISRDVQEDWRCLSLGREPLKTVEFLPSPYIVNVRSPKTHISTQMYMYDAPGERFLYRDLPMEDFYVFTNAIMFVIDPFSITGYALEHRKEIELIRNQVRPDNEGIMINVFDWIMEMLKAFFNIAEDESCSLPIAIILTKVDALDLEYKTGKPAAQRLMAKNPLLHSEEDAINLLVRSFLCSYGLEDLVDAIESKFTNLKYFSCSALGRLPKPGDNSSFTPFRVIEPLLWLLSHF